jgi:YD repeat-containing protein
VLTLGYSRKSVRLLVFRSSSQTWVELHEKAFRRLGGVTRVVVLDNLREGVLTPDIYETTLNPLYRDMLRCYDDTQSFNNQTDVWEYGFGSAPSAASCPAPSGFTRHKHTSYYTNGNYLTDAVYLVSLPITQQVMDASNNVVAETDYTYDSTGIGWEASITGHTSTAQTSFPAFTTGYTTRGNVTGVSRRVSSSSSISTSATYDIAGNVLTSVDGNQKQTNFSYSDSFSSSSASWASSLAANVYLSSIFPFTAYPYGNNTFAFPTSVTNALNQTTSATYGYNAGKPASTRDANGAVTTYDYTDPLQRLIQETYPLGNYDWFQYGDTPSQMYVFKASSMTTTRSISCDPSQLQVRTYYDGLGRTTSSQEYGPNGWISTDQTYDGLGRPYQVSNPYESGADAWTTTTYDVLNRPLRVTRPDGSVTQTGYSGSGSYDLATVTDPAGNQRSTFTDGLGRRGIVFAQGPGSVSGQTYTAAD